MAGAQPIAVLPGGRRGVEYAPTRRLSDLKRRYQALADDPATDPALRRYSGDVLAEIVGELRRRNGRKAAA